MLGISTAKMVLFFNGSMEKQILFLLLFVNILTVQHAGFLKLFVVCYQEFIIYILRRGSYSHIPEVMM